MSRHSRKLARQRKSEPMPIECDYCCAIIHGEPGGWHDEMGFETCADSPTSFHEHEIVAAEPTPEAEG